MRLNRSFAALLAGAVSLTAFAQSSPPATPAKQEKSPPPTSAPAANPAPQNTPVAMGKLAPALNITEARGISKTAKLEDYRGKWVVVDFWGYWCPPCVGISIPAWMEFAEKHKDQASDFQILTVHDTQQGRNGPITTIAALEPEIANLQQRTWKGKKFELPVILDTTLANVRNYRISGWPSAFLIDPQGVVVQIEVGANGTVERMLAEKLATLKKEKAGAKGAEGTTDEKPKKDGGEKPTEAKPAAAPKESKPAEKPKTGKP